MIRPRAPSAFNTPKLSAKWYGVGYQRGADWIRRCADKGATEEQLRMIADRMTSDYYGEIEPKYEPDFIGGFMAATRSGD